METGKLHSFGASCLHLNMTFIGLVIWKILGIICFAHELGLHVWETGKSLGELELHVSFVSTSGVTNSRHVNASRMLFQNSTEPWWAPALLIPLGPLWTLPGDSNWLCSLVPLALCTWNLCTSPHPLAGETLAKARALGPDLLIPTQLPIYGDCVAPTKLA